MTRTGPADLQLLSRPAYADAGSIVKRNLSDRVDFQVGLLTGGGDKPYAFGLATALAAQGVSLDFIGSDEIDSPALHCHQRLRFLNFRGSQDPTAPLPQKVWRIAKYYGRLIHYASTAKAPIFHILWNNKFQTFDRTLLMAYYRLQKRKIALTVHNVNAAKRDSHDSWLNRFTLGIQYRLADHLFVHTEAMRDDLLNDFGIKPAAVTVIPLGVNNSVPDTELTPQEAKARLGLNVRHKTILFFGHIGPYKGLHYLVEAFQRLAAGHDDFRLLIVGKPKSGAEQYWQDIEKTIANGPGRSQIIKRIEFVPDEDTELYFKAADVLALPYTQIFQSGVLILAYTFGLPVVVADVGSLKADVFEGRTGFVCKPHDPRELTRALESYFVSDVFTHLSDRRQFIRNYGRERFSWDTVTARTLQVYRSLTA